jgi:hypothetical protein
MSSTRGSLLPFLGDGFPPEGLDTQNAADDMYTLICESGDTGAISRRSSTLSGYITTFVEMYPENMEIQIKGMLHYHDAFHSLHQHTHTHTHRHTLCSCRMHLPPFPVLITDILITAILRHL